MGPRALSILVRLVLAALSVAFAAAPTGVFAKTLGTTLTMQVTIQSGCGLQTEDMHFGSGTFLNGVIDASAVITVRCGPNTPYSVSIDNGQNFNATRRMWSGSGNGGPSYVPYEIYRNAIRTQRWGATVATMASGTTPSNGAPVLLTAYGRVLNTKVLAKPYEDTVTITLNF